MFKTEISIDGYDDQYCHDCNLKGEFWGNPTCTVYGSLELEENGFKEGSPFRHKKCLLAQKYYIESVVLTNLYYERSLAIRKVNEWEAYLESMQKNIGDLSDMKEKLERFRKEEFEIIDKVKQEEKKLETLKCLLQKL